MSTQDTESSELAMPDEGMGTLMAQITREWIDKIIRIIHDQRSNGNSDPVIFNALKQSLPDFDKHTLARILALSRDEPIEEDFPAELITETHQPKPNTVVLTLSGQPADLKPFSLARYNDTDWIVLEAEGNTWTLKLLD